MHAARQALGIIINPFGRTPQDTPWVSLLLSGAGEDTAQAPGTRRRDVRGLGGKVLGQAGRALALRTPRAMECVCGDRKDTLSTTTAFTTMRMVTTRRKVRYLPGRGRQEAGPALRYCAPRCHPYPEWLLSPGPSWGRGRQGASVHEGRGGGGQQAWEPGLLADEWHCLGGLGHLLGHKEEEDRLGQEHVDGDGTLLAARCP